MLRFTSHHSPCIAFVVLLLILGQHQALSKGYISAPQTSDEVTLRLIAAQFFTHYAKEDLNSFMSLWSVNSPDRAARQLAAEKFFAAFEKVEAKTLDIRRLLVEGATARVWVVSEMRAVEAASGKPSNSPLAGRRVLHFVKEKDGSWKVWREESAQEELAASLAEAGEGAVREALLAREKELLDKELVRALIRQSERIRLRGDYALGLTISGLARTIGEQVGDKEGESDALYATGFIQRLRGDYQQALDSFLQSLKIREELGDAAKTASAFNQVGYVYYLQADFGRAMEYFRKSLMLSEAAGDKARIADALMSIAAIEGDRGNYAQALESYQRGAELAAAASNNSVLARALNDAAIIHRKLGNYAQALENYRKTLQLFEAAGDKGRVGIILNNIGAVYRLEEDYNQALYYYRRSLSLREAQGSKQGIMSSLNNVGEIQLLQVDYDGAAANFERSLKLSEELGERQSSAVILNNLGHLYRLRGDYERSLDFYQKSLTIREALGDREGISSTLNSLGLLYRRRGDYQQAARLAERSLLIARQINSRDNLRTALTLVGASYSALNQNEQARRALEEAILTIESLRTNISGQEARANYLASVREPYDLYIDLLMRLHRQTPSAGYDRMALETSERARARSLIESLTEARADIRAGLDPALLARERTLRQQLNAGAERQARLLSGKGGATKEQQAAVLEEEIKVLTAEYRDVQAQIRQSSPRYAALTQPSPLSLKELQQQVLDRETVLLEYALGEEKSYLWAVTADTLTSFELPNRTRIETEARRVRDLLADGRRWATDETIKAEYEKAAMSLSRMLMPDDLVRQLGAKRLVVISDGALQYLPFGALPVPQAKAPGTRGAITFLIARHEIVSLPSASTLGVLRREAKGQQSAAKKTVAVFADPVFDAKDERVAVAVKSRWSGAESPAGNSPVAPLSAKQQEGREQAMGQPENPARPASQKLSPQLVRAARATGVLRDGEQSLTRLPFSRREAEMILASVPAGAGRKALDFEANLKVATSDELANYRFVHFATHGLLNNEHPELSGIVLSLIDERGRSVDGFLRLNEIYNLRLPVEMVVLSACQTALGREIRGEGLVGLVHAFMYAGSPRVVASLWKVDDRATAELMRRFYEGMLKENLRPAAALRQAKAEMLKEERWRAPFYWAAFELQGEWR